MTMLRKWCAAAIATLIAGGSLIVGGASPAAAGTHPGIDGPIYYAVVDGIFRVNPDGSGQQLLVPQSFTMPNEPGVTYERPEDPAISADGAKLAFSMLRQPGGTRYLFTMDPNVAGSYATVPGEEWPLRGEAPTWSPEGTRLVYVSDSDLYLWSQNDHRPVRLTVMRPDQGLAREASDPEWSPDGQFIAFVRTNLDHFDGEVVAMKPLHLAAQRSLGYFAPQSPVASPSWRPDSSRVVFYGVFGPVVVVIDSQGNATQSYTPFGLAGAGTNPVYAPSSSGTNEVFVVNRSITQYWFITSNGNNASRRGPIAGGRGTSWSTQRSAVPPILAGVLAPPSFPGLPQLPKPGDVLRSPTSVLCALVQVGCPVLRR